MSDAISVATKETCLTNATGVSRTSLRSSRTRRKEILTKADWRVVVRDSYAALFDMVGDWTYLYAIFHRDYDGDGTPDTYLLGVQFDYKLIINVVLAFCILSTVLSLWTILTSLGRKCGKNSMCCNCTVPRISLAAIVLEDLPQFILTTWIDFTFSGGFTPAGVLNICSSMTALINRATTSYDDIEQKDEDAFPKLEMDTVYERMSA
mmetsp:Transcript_20092/g.43616  ORF Transcript_20092/g.43616 Transcript_20092/m.43616 type:complete len:207 (+) Transcript_20092:110-730(+)